MFFPNTHFGSEEVQCEAVKGFGGPIGNALAILESAEITHSIFESAMEIDFIEAGISHGVVKESVLDEILSESVGEKVKGFFGKAIETVKKLWSTIINAIDSAIKSIEDFVQKHVDKFLNKIQVKSKEELKGKLIKKYTKIDLSKLELKRPASEDYFAKSKEELEKLVAKSSTEFEKEIIKEASGKEYNNIGEFKSKFIEECFAYESNVSIANVIDEAITYLKDARTYTRNLKDLKKKINASYNDTIKGLKSRAKSVRSTGGYSDTTPDGKTSKVEYNDGEKEVYALGTKVTLTFLAARHKLDIALIDMKRKAFSKGVAQARAIVLSAAISKGKKEDAEADETTVEDSDAQNEFAMMLEHQEFAVEMQLSEIEDEVELEA